MFDRGVAVQTRDRRNPTIWQALQSDSMTPIDDEVRRVLIADQSRWTRRYVRPIARVISRVSVAFIVAVKRVLPFQFSSHRGIDRLCIWFMRHFVSAEAGWLLLRHFVTETNVINFVIRNGHVGSEEVDLQPRNLGELNNSAVILHDVNMYNLIIDAGDSATIAQLLEGSPKPQEHLDFSMLACPAIDAEPQRRRWMRLDLETALCFMNIAFCLFTSEDEYERAVNSLQLDESFMSLLATITGDELFRSWRPMQPMVAISISRDVPRDLYWHAVIHEYAHEHLLRIRRRVEVKGDA